MENILIVEDDESISDLIKMNLNLAGYTVLQALDGSKALKMIKDNVFNLIILDVMLPEIDGFEVMEHIKEYDIPVIFLTAKDSILDKVKGLRLGADDYIVKPFECIELLARIEAVLRRYSKGNNTIKYKNIEVLLEERIVKKNDEAVELTYKEFDLLNLLISNKGMALSRELILEKIWGYDYFGETRTVDMHIQRLRKKLNLEDSITTVFKVGYRLEK
ncbi:response regulator transcription factor [Clostridium oryzae]|uniref:Stage 0 sporulation protein A homolog n=1 Tax=Clostridium oryzae TaxID=1450648 RepID=A0A1V4IDW6_9CLOT|nr:transcriptional regulatory protein YycF [Clostridium oryzae]